MAIYSANDIVDRIAVGMEEYAQCMGDIAQKRRLE